jgi:RNA polymerase-binding protein DksA
MSPAGSTQLSPADLLSYAQILRRDHEQLGHRLLDLTSQAAGAGTIGSREVTDTKDSALLEQLDETLSAQISGLRRRVAAIDAALTRIDNGSYGICQGCGKGIGAQRLHIEPSASRCLACQENREHHR